jgi:hypothetical protein
MQPLLGEELESSVAYYFIYKVNHSTFAGRRAGIFSRLVEIYKVNHATSFVRRAGIFSHIVEIYKVNH